MLRSALVVCTGHDGGIGLVERGIEYKDSVIFEREVG